MYGVNATAGIFATYPQEHVSTWQGFVDQVHICSCHHLPSNQFEVPIIYTVRIGTGHWPLVLAGCCDHGSKERCREKHSSSGNRIHCSWLANGIRVQLRRGTESGSRSLTTSLHTVRRLGTRGVLVRCNHTCLMTSKYAEYALQVPRLQLVLGSDRGTTCWRDSRHWPIRSLR